MMDELFIEEIDFPNKNEKADAAIDDSLNAIDDSSTVVFEAERTAFYKGVRGCNAERDKSHVIAVAKTFANQKAEETGLTLVSHGWRGYKARRRNGSRPWPDNSRWCTSHITVQCYAIFTRLMLVQAAQGNYLWVAFLTPSSSTHK